MRVHVALRKVRLTSVQLVNLKSLFRKASKVGMTVASPGPIARLTAPTHSQAQLTLTLTLTHSPTQPYNKKHLDGTHKLVRVSCCCGFICVSVGCWLIEWCAIHCLDVQAITDRDLVMMIPKMEAEENAGINITFNSERTRVSCLSRHAIQFSGV